jgi:molybdopterin-guanine dinucleotide biosynthesis protein A
MGQDKASLIHPDGRTLARRCFDLLRETGCEEVYLSLRAAQEIPAGFEDVAKVKILRDAEESHGPLGGILAALDSRPDADWLVVACDLPKLDRRTLARLLEPVRTDEMFRMFRSEMDGQPEPLCGFYGKGAREILREGWQMGNFSIRRILSQSKVRLLEPVTTGALENANTRDDWTRFRQMEPLNHTPEWKADLISIWISDGHDFKGRHDQGRLDHGIREVSEVRCVNGLGLEGDRYFGYRPDFKGQVTFFDSEVVEAVRKAFGLPELPASVFRRNLIVQGVDLADWVGKRFRFQGVEFEGAEECKPCYWMDEAVRPGVNEFLKERFRGGLRARILSDGILKTGRTV